MRVAYITMQFPVPSETFACNDVRALRQLGVDISVHGLRSAHDSEKTLLQERDLVGLSVTHTTWLSHARGLGFGLLRPKLFANLLGWLFRVNTGNREHLLKSLALTPRALEVLAHLEQDPPDVVHIYWGHYPSIVGHLVKCYLPDTPVSVSLAAYDLEGNYGTAKAFAKEANAVRTLAQANVSQFSAVTGIPEDKITVIYDSVDITRMEHIAQDSLLERKVPKRIVTSGRLHRSKGMDDVLDIFAEVLRRYPEATLHILGDGDERERLERKSADLGLTGAVAFKGHVNHDEVFSEMAEAEVFLFMSKAKGERLPNVVKEAMLCECLCVATDTVGIEELMPQDCGFVVPRGDVTQAAKHLLYALENPAEKLNMLANAKVRILEHFDLEKAAQAYKTMWTEAIEARSPDIEREVTHAQPAD